MVEFLILNYITKEELAKIRSRFNAGKHLKINSIKKQNSVVNNVEINIEEQVSTDVTENKYRIKDRGVEVIICTSNHYVYEYYKIHEEYPEDLKCMRCNKHVTSVYGIPIRKNVNVYDVYGVYHNLVCAYDIYIRYYRNDILFRNSEQLFREIAYRLTGSSDIAEAKDINLLETNNGPLNVEEYDDESIKIENESSMVFMPVKRLHKMVKQDK